MALPSPESLILPSARRDPDSGYVAHERWFADPYAWMEDLEAPETLAWMEAQEAVTRAVLNEAPGRRAWLRERLVAAHRVEPFSRPMRGGNNEFSWRSEPGDQKPRLTVRRGHAEPVDLLNPNSWPAEDALVMRLVLASPAGASH